MSHSNFQDGESFKIYESPKSSILPPGALLEHHHIVGVPTLCSEIICFCGTWAVTCPTYILQHLFSIHESRQMTRAKPSWLDRDDIKVGFSSIASKEQGFTALHSASVPLQSSTPTCRLPNIFRPK